MTTVSIIKKDNKVSIEMNGHSGYAKSGMDIVCSALSILSFSFAEYCFQRGITITKHKQDEGYFFIEIKDPEKRAKEALFMFEIGVSALNQNFPDYVFVKVGRN